MYYILCLSKKEATWKNKRHLDRKKNTLKVHIFFYEKINPTFFTQSLRFGSLTCMLTYRIEAKLVPHRRCRHSKRVLSLVNCCD